MNPLRDWDSARSHLPNPSKGYSRIVTEGHDTLEFRLDYIAESLASDREMRREAATVDRRKALRECRNRIETLTAALGEVAPGGAAFREISELVHQLEKHERFLQDMWPRANSHDALMSAILDLVQLYAENAGITIEDLSPGAKEGEVNGLIAFVHSALDLMGETRSVSTVWDRVNDLIRIARCAPVVNIETE